MECNFEETLTFKSLTLTACLGLLSSAILLVVSLWRNKHRDVLGRLVAGLAVANIACNATVLIPSWIDQKRFFVFPSVTGWCTSWVYLTWSCIYWSELLSGAIAVAVLLAQQGWTRAVDRMRWAPVLLLPTAFLVNVGLLANEATDQPDTPQTPRDITLNCVPGQGSYYLFVAVLLLVLFTITGVTSYSLWQFWRTASPSVTKRAWNCCARYLAAFVMTWWAKCVSLIFTPASGTELSCNQWAITFVSDCFVFLSGFWNLLAYTGLDFRPRAVRFSRSFVSPGAASTEPRPGSSVELDATWQILVASFVEEELPESFQRGRPAEGELTTSWIPSRRTSRTSRA